MNGLCNLENVVYQGIIYSKENVKDKKNLYIYIYIYIIIAILSPMNI